MTTENNKLIAEFLGWKEQEEDFMFNPKTSGSIYVKSLLFHKDWNWLMEVVEKIESLGFYVKTLKQTCVILDINEKTLSLSIYEETKIKAVYDACLDFIKWYNENSAKNN